MVYRLKAVRGGRLFGLSYGGNLSITEFHPISKSDGGKSVQVMREKVENQ